MTPKAIAIIIFFIASLSCSFDKNKSVVDKNNQQIKTVQILLFPAFNNSSYIIVDKAENTIYFRVDSTHSVFDRKLLPDEYKSRLDSFEKNTLIDSFYSTSFLDSIKSKPNTGVWDGLSIVTIVNRQGWSDTIESGNIYPQILSKNIISQINCISKSTKDTLLKKYMQNLKTYFR